MLRTPVRLCLPIFVLALLLGLVKVQDVDQEVLKEVIMNSTPCSATCGPGVLTQTLCLLDNVDVERAQVSENCRLRKVMCLESQQCGLKTMTVTSGQRVKLDCLSDVTEEIGGRTWRVEWRYAPGIITADEYVFAHWKPPQRNHVILDPVREKDAGTYRCVVQNKLRTLMRAYWGIRVLPAGVLNLDYDSALTKWDNEQNQTVTHLQDQSKDLLLIGLIPVSLVCAVAGLLLGLYRAMRTGKIRYYDKST